MTNKYSRKISSWKIDSEETEKNNEIQKKMQSTKYAVNAILSSAHVKYRNGIKIMLFIVHIY